MGGVFKIAKSGGNALTDAEKDLVFTSERSCIMEMFSGYVDVVTNEIGIGTGSFTHNLGYRPAYYCFVRDPDATGNWYPLHDGNMGLIANVDTTKIYFSIDKEENKTYKVYYSIWGNQQDNDTGTGNSNVSGNLRVAKSGYDALTETDARNMQFFSGKNTFKVDSALSGSHTENNIATDDVTIITIAHNLGYVPYAFVLCSTFGHMLPDSTFVFPSFSYYVNSTNLVIEIVDFSEAPTYNATFKYKILRDKIA